MEEINKDEYKKVGNCLFFNARDIFELVGWSHNEREGMGIQKNGEVLTIVKHRI